VAFQAVDRIILVPAFPNLCYYLLASHPNIFLFLIGTVF